jgi:tetratricopeptide (TPR) repeat protein
VTFPRTRIFALWFVISASFGCASSTGSARATGAAILLVDKGRYAEARVPLEARLASHPEDAAARRLLIRVHGFRGDLGAARKEAERLAAQLGPGSPLPWIELGHALELAHRYDEALAFYDRAAEVAPRDPAGPRTGGLRSARWGERELARPRLEEALRRAPRDASTWHALGVVLLELGELDQAEHAYRSGLLADPRALENRIGLATLALVRRDASAALHEYDSILAARPRFADAQLGRAWALAELSRFTEAERALADAVRLGASPAIVTRQRKALAARRNGLVPGAPADQQP